MKHLAIMFAISLFGCQSVPVHESTRRGLTAQGNAEVNRLLVSQDETDALGLELHLRSIAQSGERQSVLVLTYAMIELPWIPELYPESRNDRRMPKVAVEACLDDLLASSERENLSADYFRAIVGRGELAAAEEALLNWTLENLPTLMWRASEFSGRWNDW